MLASQGHRDQAYEAVGVSNWPDDLVVHAWVEGALGEPERAMELLREKGRWGGEQGIHGLAHYWLWSLRDYPPLREFIEAGG